MMAVLVKLFRVSDIVICDLVPCAESRSTAAVVSHECCCFTVFSHITLHHLNAIVSKPSIYCFTVFSHDALHYIT